MKNPWTKKNPFMSMWLSGANAVAGSTRARITAEARRQATNVEKEAAKQVVNFWTDVLSAQKPAPAKRRKRR